jgi:hypothetical protein
VHFASNEHEYLVLPNLVLNFEQSHLLYACSFLLLKVEKYSMLIKHYGCQETIISSLDGSNYHHIAK